MTYLALLVVIAATGAVLGAGATVWSAAQQRERERELLWAGEQIRQALRAYAMSGGGRYPDRLEDLLEDPRQPALRRHLRRIYADPMTHRTDWMLLRDARGGIVGVHSRSQRAPLKTGGFGGAQAGFADAKSYADWRFAVAAATPASAASAPAARRGAAPPAATSAAAPRGTPPIGSVAPAGPIASPAGAGIAPPFATPPAADEDPAEPDDAAEPPSR